MAVNRNFVTDFSKYEINPSREDLSIATASHTGRAWFYFWIVTHTTLENKYKNLPISFCIFLPSTWVILYHVFHLTRDWCCPRNTLFIQTQLTIMNRKKKINSPNNHLLALHISIKTLTFFFLQPKLNWLMHSNANLKTNRSKYGLWGISRQSSRVKE